MRNYFASFVKSDVDELTSFFTDDALYVDGPRGVHRGIDAIRAEFEAIVQIVPSTTVDIKALVANGGTVMFERVDNFEIGASHSTWKSSGCSTSTTTAASRAGTITTT